jgi:3-oxoacyl-[acyl-carrier-protein] synthase III
MRRAVITGTGRYVPPRIVTNDELTQWMDTSDEWIRQRTGIEKQILGQGSTVCFLGLGSGLTWGAVVYRFAV